MRRAKYQMPENMVVKYNTPTCTRITFTAQGLENLNNKYHAEVRGLPGFIHNFLKGRPSRHRDGIVKAVYLYPVLEELDSQSLTLLMPNPTYHEHITDPKKIEALKYQSAGFGLVSWFIYPALFNEHFKRQENDAGGAPGYGIMQQFKNHIEGEAQNQLDEFPQWYRTGSMPEDEFKRRGAFSKLDRSNSQEFIVEMEEQYDHQPYLATILDLDVDPKFSLQYLTQLKKNVMDHLQRVYKVDRGDQVNFYFHFPYYNKTTTLHLHVRVNQEAHGLELGRCFMLDDIIHQLETGKTVKALILARGAIHVDGDGDKIFKEVDVIDVKEKVENPFFDINLSGPIWNLQEAIKYFYSKKSVAGNRKLPVPEWLVAETITLLRGKAEQLSYGQLTTVLSALGAIMNYGENRPSQNALRECVQNSLDALSKASKAEHGDSERGVIMADAFRYSTQPPHAQPKLMPLPKPNTDQLMDDGLEKIQQNGIVLRGG